MIKSNENQKKLLSSEELRINRVIESATKKKYSVLMSIYYKENPDFVKQAIDSMYSQTVLPDEIVIVEDGELTNELYDVLDSYPNIKRISNSENLGLGLSLNIGLKECSNELVARMDTDDISKPDRCEKQLERFCQRPYLSILGTQIEEFEGDIDNIVSRRIVPLSSEDIYDFSKRRSAFNHPTVMFSKTAVIENDGYSDLRRNQDVDLFGRMQFNGYKAENLDDYLLLFRASDGLSERRKSWSNTRSYIATIRKFWKKGYSSFFDYILVLFSQVFFFIAPIKVQEIIYKKFLRK